MTDNVDALVGMDRSKLPTGYAVISMIESGELDRYLGRILAATQKRLEQDDNG